MDFTGACVIQLSAHPVASVQSQLADRCVECETGPDAIIPFQHSQVLRYTGGTG